MACLSKPMTKTRIQTPKYQTSHSPALFSLLCRVCATSATVIHTPQSRLWNTTRYSSKCKDQKHLQAVNAVLQHSLEKKKKSALYPMIK